jgi:23S rRNA (uracil1939-C5)-methyltransferase
VLALDVTEMALDGDALGRLGGYVVLVAGAIPGERVEVEVVAAERKHARARLRRVIKPSPQRVVPRCRHFGPCGGCAWQHIAYPEQLRLKARMLASALEHALGSARLPVLAAIGLEPRDAADPREPATSAPWGFRNKVHFVCGRGAEGLVMGHYVRSSREVLPVVECPVHADEGNRVAFELSDVLRRRGVAGFDEDALEGAARHVIVRVAESDGTAQVVLVGRSTRRKQLEAAARELASGPAAPAGIHLNFHDGAGPYVLGREGVHAGGAERLLETVGGVRFALSPRTFFQTSVRAAEALLDVVLRFVGGSGPGPVLDLYAGAGLFALPLARRGRRVVAVEQNPGAVRDAISSLELNGIPRGSCRYLRSRVEDAVRGLTRGVGPGPRRFAAAVLDPPRDGCPAEVLEVLSRGLQPGRLVYVSCNLRALGRDLAVVLDAGYRLEAVQPVDMFPHTAHIECVALLSRSSTPAGRSPTRDRRRRRDRPAR